MDGDINSFGKVKILAEITSGFIGDLFSPPVTALVSSGAQETQFRRL